MTYPNQTKRSMTDPSDTPTYDELSDIQPDLQYLMTSHQVPETVETNGAANSSTQDAILELLHKIVAEREESNADKQDKKKREVKLECDRIMNKELPAFDRRKPTVFLQDAHQLIEAAHLKWLIDETAEAPDYPTELKDALDAAVGRVIVAALPIDAQAHLPENIRTLSAVELLEAIEREFVDKSDAKQEELRRVADKIRLTRNRSIDDYITKHRQLRKDMAFAGCSEVLREKDVETTTINHIVRGLRGNEFWTGFRDSIATTLPKHMPTTITELDELMRKYQRMKGENNEHTGLENTRWRFPKGGRGYQAGLHNAHTAGGYAQHGNQQHSPANHWNQYNGQQWGTRQGHNGGGHNGGRTRNNGQNGNWRNTGNRNQYRNQANHGGNGGGNNGRHNGRGNANDDKIEKLQQQIEALSQQIAMTTQAHNYDDNQGKSHTFILDSGAIPSYVRRTEGFTPNPTQKTCVRTASGVLTTNKAVDIPLKTKTRMVRTPALVHNRLPHNLLSLKPIVDDLGAVLMDKKGAALVTDSQLKQLDHAIQYFAKRHKGLYKLKLKNGAICLGAQPAPTHKQILPPEADAVSQSRPAQPEGPPRAEPGGAGATADQQGSAEAETQQTPGGADEQAPNHVPHAAADDTEEDTQEQPRDRQATTRARRRLQATTRAPREQPREAAFQLPAHQPAPANKMPKYQWHLILNHASPEVLTKLARNPHIRIPELDTVTTTHDMTCRGCFEGKLARAPHRRKAHSYKRGEAVSTDIFGPLTLPGMPPTVKRYFITFVDAYSRYAYVQPIGKRAEAAQLIQEFLTRMQKSLGHTPCWLVSDNAGEYMSSVVADILADMDVEHLPVIAYNSEENGVAERINRTLMNAVRAALTTAGMKWEYWTWALNDAVDKYNQLPHRTTDTTPHQLWFNQNAPDLSNLRIFGQLGYVPVMSKTVRATKHKNRGQLVRYLSRDSPSHIIAETTDGAIRRYRARDFHAYHVASDPTAAFSGSLRHVRFDNKDPQTGEPAVQEVVIEEPGDADDGEKDRHEESPNVALNAKIRRRITQAIPKQITPVTPNPATRKQALRYPDRQLWAKSLNQELDKLDANGAIKWLQPADLGLIPKNTRIIPLTLSFNYKRDKAGDIEERKSRASLRGDLMLEHVHFDPKCTSAPMVDRIAARMVISHNVENGWVLEHLDVKSAFLHEKYRYRKPVWVREMARADGSYKHGRTIGLLKLNLYGNPSGTYYYVDGLLEYLRQVHAQMNQAEVCLIRIEMEEGVLIMAVAVDDFLVTASNAKVMDEFYHVMKAKYDIKRLGRPRRYLGWHFHYAEDGSIALSQRGLIDKTLQDADMLMANGKHTPYPTNESYHPPSTEDTEQPETRDKYMQIIGDIRYIADSTRPDLAYVAGRLGAAMSRPTTRHWRIMIATLRYLKKTRNYGLFFKRNAEKKSINVAFKTSPICASSDADWANDVTDRRSITGGLITYRGRPVAWMSKKQPTVALSTAEAEYRAMAEVTQRAIYTQTLATSFDKKPAEITLENDNMPALDMMAALGATKRSKFIDMRHHYLKQTVKEHNITLKHVASADLRADMFTKALERTRFEKLRSSVHVHEVPNIDDDLM